MKNIYLFLLFLLFPLTGCYSQTGNETSPALIVPQEKQVQSLTAPAEGAVKEDPNSWDFGTVKAGEILDHDFFLKNESQAKLTITGTSTSCGCTVSEISKRELQPQESTAIKAKFNSKGYKGPVQQYVYVNTDDTANPVIKFTIKMNVEGEIVAP